MSFIANRNHDFSGPTTDLENEKDLIQYSWVFLWGKLQRLLEFGIFFIRSLLFHECQVP